MENKEEAMKTDLSSSILEVIDPIYEEVENGKEVRTEFYVAMDDKGLEVIAERTGLLNMLPDYNSIDDVIKTDGAFINVYLSVDTNKDVTLETQIVDDRAATDLVAVPLTENEENSFLQYAQKAIEMDDIMHGYSTREEAIQYALNQGTGIVDYFHASADALESAETSQLEKDTAKREGREPREVEAETVEYFYQGAKEDAAILYAVKNDMALLDLDEWQATNEATGLQLSWEDANKIINVLYENYDFSPLDIPDDHKTDSIKEALILDNLSSADEARIYDVLSKYGDNHLEPTRSSHQIAEEIEQLMFERGEYDFAESDRVRWLDNASVPEPHQLAENSDILIQARQDVRTQIEESVTKSPTEIDALTNYLKDQLAEMADETDDLIPKAEGLISALEDYKEHVLVEELEKAEAKDNKLSLDEINQLRGLSLKDVELSEGHFDLVPLSEYLEDTYGSPGYVMADELNTDDILSAIHNLDDDWNIDDDDIQDALYDAAADVRSYLEKIDGVVAVNEDGTATLIPLYLNDDGILMTTNDVEKAVIKLIPNEIEIEAYGRVIDIDWYTPPEAETVTIAADVVLELDVSAFLEESMKENISIVKEEYQAQKDTELAYDIIKSANCSVKENDAGTYDVIDNIDGNYRAIDCESLEEVIGALDNIVDSSLLDYMADELQHSDEYAQHGSDIPIPLTTDEWKEFAQRPEFAEFVSDHQTEFEEIELVSDPDRLKNANIREVAHTFYPESKEHGAKVEEQLSAFEAGLLSELINSEGYELDREGKEGSYKYLLYDTESHEYVKDSSGNPFMHSASDVLENMSARIEEIQQSLEDSYEGNQSLQEDAPSTPAEWVSFAGRPENKAFVEDHLPEINAMRLVHNDAAKDILVSIHEVYEIQNKRLSQEKDSPKKDTKKIDRTDD